MILGRERIFERVREDRLIEEFRGDCLEGAGYDLRVGRIYRLKSGGYIGVSSRDNPAVEEVRFDEYPLEPGEYILFETVERVNMPDDLMARILPRSSVFRAGCSLMNAVVDPGYEGTLTLGLRNLSRHVFRFERGARMAQIVFEEVAGKTKPYEGRYQGGRVV